jgi:predicted 3-demethylubiquinone-9 3-methyltransferase (glyoxalase superfamily)
MKKITPMLWFDSQAEEAARFYTSVFDDSKIKTITRYGDAAAQAAGRPKGSVMTVAFEIEGQEFVGLNGGPQFKFSEAISFVVNCKTQKEIDELWTKLTAGGGQPGPCGWLKDKYGLERPEEIGTSHGGADEDDQARHRDPRARRPGLTKPGSVPYSHRRRHCWTSS